MILVGEVFMGMFGLAGLTTSIPCEKYAKKGASPVTNLKLEFIKNVCYFLWLPNFSWVKYYLITFLYIWKFYLLDLSTPWLMFFDLRNSSFCLPSFYYFYFQSNFCITQPSTQIIWNPDLLPMLKTFTLPTLVNGHLLTPNHLLTFQN